MSRLAARDLHIGDGIHQADWTLHVTHVDVEAPGVAVAVAEFGFALHYPPAQVLDVDVAVTLP